jgi:hypothetical protein
MINCSFSDSAETKDQTISFTIKGKQTVSPEIWLASRKVHFYCLSSFYCICHREARTISAFNSPEQTTEYEEKSVKLRLLWTDNFIYFFSHTTFLFSLSTADKKTKFIVISTAVYGDESCSVCIQKDGTLRRKKNFLSTMSCASLSDRNRVRKNPIYTSYQWNEITFQFPELKVGYPSCSSPILHRSDKLFFLRFNINPSDTQKASDEILFPVEWD